MPHAFTNHHIHLVFSTKERVKLLSKERQLETWSYMSGICKNTGLIPVAINGMADHAHLLFHLPPTVALAKAVSSIKANSSRWLNEILRLRSGFRLQAPASLTPAKQLKIRLARGIWSLQRQRLECGRSGKVHSQSAAAPQEDDL